MNLLIGFCFSYFLISIVNCICACIAQKHFIHTKEELKMEAKFAAWQAAVLFVIGIILIAYEAT